jgi:membrane fusion protein, multidrug efflux system
VLANELHTVADGKAAAIGNDHANIRAFSQKGLQPWIWLLAALIVIVFVAIVLGIVFLPTSDVWTDDAYVTAHYAAIAPRVSGQVSSVAVDDNEVVRGGQVLVTLDDRDFRTAVARAGAQLSRDQAQVADSASSVTRQPAVIEQRKAEIDRIQARVALAQANDRRYRNLAATGAGPVENRDVADSALREEQAQVAGAIASLRAAQFDLDILKAEHSASEAKVQADQAELAQANLNLSYTKIVAPLNGMIAERNVQVGNYVGPGAAIMAVVPLDQVYIEAQYRESALRHMLPGQRVRIHVDAYDVVLDGVVDSIPPNSGAIFAPIPPDNATGNFTKIVQRFPVKIVLVPGQSQAALLRLGLSVETTVHTDLADVLGGKRDPSRRATAP